MVRLRRGRSRRVRSSSKIAPIGFVQSFRNENVTAFMQALRDAGYIDGQTALIETRIFDKTFHRLPVLAKELVDLKCDVIVAGSCKIKLIDAFDHRY